MNSYRLTDVGIVGPMLRPSHLYGEHLVLVSPGFLDCRKSMKGTGFDGVWLVVF